MAEEIPQWAFDQFCERAGVDYQKILAWPGADGVRVRKLAAEGARTIAQHEQPPVDPDLVKAREICARLKESLGFSILAGDFRKGDFDNDPEVQFALSALKEARNA